MIPKRWEDPTLTVINYLRDRSELSGVTITRTKRDNTLKQIVIDTEPMQLDTPISRRIGILLEAWVYGSNGNTIPADSYELMDETLYELQCAPQNLKQVISFEQPIGPRVVKDDAGTEYHEGGLTWIVSQ